MLARPPCIAALVTIAGCSQSAIALDNLACDGDACLLGWICHPVERICVVEIAVGCSNAGEVCPSDVETGSACDEPGSFVPCETGGGACEQGCRTCNDDYTWSECSEPACQGDSCPCEPSGVEVCNGKDDDCDGTVDNEGAGGCVSYFADRDGDNLGDAGDSRCLCAAESPYTAAGAGDCDDTLAACTTDCATDLDLDQIVDCSDDCIDQDGDTLGTGTGCSGSDCDDRFASCTVDCTDSDADGIPDCGATCHDDDGDGYGNGAACLGSDCDDDPVSGCGAACRPGLSEVCDGWDNDCSGTADDDASDCTVFYNDQDRDGAGDDSASLCLCATTGDYDAVTGGDCEPTDPDAYPGAPEIYDGVNNDCDADTDECVADCNCGADLVACYPFDGDANDASGNGNDPTTLTSVSYTSGEIGQAIQISSASEVYVPDSPSLDVTALTIEAWIRPSTIPSSGRMGIFDNNGQYGFFVVAGGAVRCSAGGAATSTATLSAGTWTHVACTSDGATVTVYIDGQPDGSAAATPMSTASTDYAAIGANSPSGDTFDGLIDSLRVWRVRRAASEICAVAGNCP